MNKKTVDKVLKVGLAHALLVDAIRGVVLTEQECSNWAVLAISEPDFDTVVVGDVDLKPHMMVVVFSVLRALLEALEPVLCCPKCGNTSEFNLVLTVEKDYRITAACIDVFGSTKQVYYNEDDLGDEDVQGEAVHCGVCKNLVTMDCVSRATRNPERYASENAGLTVYKES